MQTLKAWQSPTFLHTNGEAAVAPPGGSSMELPPKAYFPNTDLPPGALKKLFKLNLLKKRHLGELRV